jgi:hypothetical protein
VVAVRLEDTARGRQRNHFQSRERYPPRYDCNLFLQHGSDAVTCDREGLSGEPIGEVMKFENQSPEDAPVAPAHSVPNEPTFEILSDRLRATGDWDWRTTHDRPSRRWSDPDTGLRAIDTATSRIAAQVIEGLATCGAATYAGYFGAMDSDSDSNDLAEGSPRSQRADRTGWPQDDQTLVTAHCKPDDLTRFGVIQPDPPSKGILSFVARRWAAIRRERELRQAISN